MAVAVLLVTHGQLGRHLVDTVSEMIGESPLPLDVIDIHRNQDPDEMVAKTAACAEELDQGDGVLMLTDAFGSTPSNIAVRAAEKCGARVVAGLNLPMLIRIFNYPELELEAMTQGVVKGGRQGIVTADDNNEED